MDFFFDKIQESFEHVPYPRHIKNKEKKLILKKMYSDEKTSVNLSRKIDLAGLHARIFMKINTIFTTHMFY